MKFSEPEPVMPFAGSKTIPQDLARKDSFQELDKLIGLQEVKRVLAEVSAFALIQTRRKQQQLRTDNMALHMVFKGNPGTGKTTVARILGRILNDIGILSKGHLIEVERADIVGEYIGHTAQKTREVIKKAMGGILFIDEAYSLAQGGEKDFGRESIGTVMYVPLWKKIWPYITGFFTKGGSCFLLFVVISIARVDKHLVVFSWRSIRLGLGHVGGN